MPSPEEWATNAGKSLVHNSLVGSLFSKLSSSTSLTPGEPCMHLSVIFCEVGWVEEISVKGVIIIFIYLFDYPRS